MRRPDKLMYECGTPSTHLEPLTHVQTPRYVLCTNKPMTRWGEGRRYCNGGDGSKPKDLCHHTVLLIPAFPRPCSDSWGEGGTVVTRHHQRPASNPPPSFAHNSCFRNLLLDSDQCLTPLRRYPALVYITSCSYESQDREEQSTTQTTHTS